MHASVMTFVASAVDRYRLGRQSVLDVGSRDVNGSPRELFAGDYLGIDMQAGPGVDQVLNAHELHRLAQKFEVVLSLEMLEHDDAPWLSLEQMLSVACMGALLILTARGYDERGCFPVHEYPADLWRFSVPGVRRLLEQTGWTPLSVTADPQCPGVFAVARTA